jgi:hypothetical protein
VDCFTCLRLVAPLVNIPPGFVEKMDGFKEEEEEKDGSTDTEDIEHHLSRLPAVTNLVEDSIDTQDIERCLNQFPAVTNMVGGSDTLDFMAIAMERLLVLPRRRHGPPRKWLLRKDNDDNQGAMWAVCAALHVVCMKHLRVTRVDMNKMQNLAESLLGALLRASMAALVLFCTVTDVCFAKYGDKGFIVTMESAALLASEVWLEGVAGNYALELVANACRGSRRRSDFVGCMLHHETLMPFLALAKANPDTNGLLRKIGCFMAAAATMAVKDKVQSVVKGLLALPVVTDVDKASWACLTACGIRASLLECAGTVVPVGILSPTLSNVVVVTAMEMWTWGDGHVVLKEDDIVSLACQTTLHSLEQALMLAVLCNPRFELVCVPELAMFLSSVLAAHAENKYEDAAALYAIKVTGKVMGGHPDLTAAVQGLLRATMYTPEGVVKTLLPSPAVYAMDALSLAFRLQSIPLPASEEAIRDYVLAMQSKGAREVWKQGFAVAAQCYHYQDVKCNLLRHKVLVKALTVDVDVDMRASMKGAVGFDAAMDCAICAETWGDPLSKPVKLTKTKCGHVFHEDCMLQWVDTRAASACIACPLCRAKVSVLS